jgi:hypothetical protein
VINWIPWLVIPVVILFITPLLVLILFIMPLLLWGFISLDSSCLVVGKAWSLILQCWLKNNPKPATQNILYKRILNKILELLLCNQSINY